MVKKYKNSKAGEKIIKTYDELLTKWGCDLIERDIKTSYGTTHVIETGNPDGRPLVLFHGVGDDSAMMWIYNAKKLGEHYKLYAVDTIGGPGKSIPNENYNRDFDDIRWIDEILQGLGLEKAVFAGVSHGAYLVQAYTMNRLEKVEQGISISGTVPLGGKKGSLIGMLMIFMPEALFPTDKNTVKLIKKLSGNRHTVFTDNALIMSHYKSLLQGFNNRAMGYHKIHAFSSEEVDRIRDKVTYLVGNEDPFQKLGGRNVLIENKMNAFFYDDAGHGLNHELYDEINDKMIELIG